MADSKQKVLTHQKSNFIDKINDLRVNLNWQLALNFFLEMSLMKLIINTTTIKLAISFIGMAPSGKVELPFSNETKVKIAQIKSNLRQHLLSSNRMLFASLSSCRHLQPHHPCVIENHRALVGFPTNVAALPQWVRIGRFGIDHNRHN